MKKPLRAERLAYKSIGLETVILDSKGRQEVHELNEVAGFVWNLCDGQHDIDALVEKVCNEFDVDLETALHDVNELIAEFHSKDLLFSDSE